MWLFQVVGGSSCGTAEGCGKADEEEGERVVRSSGGRSNPWDNRFPSTVVEELALLFLQLFANHGHLNGLTTVLL